MRYKRNMTDEDLFPFVMLNTASLEDLLFRLQYASMSIMEKHHSELAKDCFRSQTKRLREVIIERFGEA